MRDTHKLDLRVYTDGASLFAAACEEISRTLNRAQRDNPIASLVLTGGNTPKPVYELLSSSPFRERIDWVRTRLFWGDERCVGPEHPESNFRMVREALLAKVPVPVANIHRIPGEHADPEQAALLYERDIRVTFGDVPFPFFDLVLLGMGEDGHTASLFPGTRWDEGRLVVANFVPKFKAWRISMTPRLLNSARTVLFLTAGLAKAKALAGVLQGPDGLFPAQRIQPVNGSLIWMADQAAASLVRSAADCE